MAASLRAVALLLMLFASAAGAVELVLDSVTAVTDAGRTGLRLDSRATFEFDPATGVLSSSGTWIADYALPNGLTRYSHKVEDLAISADGRLSARSCECVEGAHGAAYLGANICGGYRFGANGVDDGGIADDEVLGPPVSLLDYRVSARDWDGQSLQLTLSGGPAGESLILELRKRSTIPRPADSIISPGGLAGGDDPSGLNDARDVNGVEINGK